MAIIGREEEFDRTANTKQVTGEGGTPLLDLSVSQAVNGGELEGVEDGVLGVSTSPGADAATHVIDHDIGADGQWSIEWDETLSANAVYIYLESTNDDRMSIRQNIIDDSGSVLEEKVHSSTHGATRVDTVLPLMGDSGEIQIRSSRMGQSPDLQGVLVFINGDPGAGANFNLDTVAHGQVSVGSDGDNSTLPSTILEGVPQGMSVRVKCPSDNTGIVYTGSPTTAGGVDADNGYPMSAGDREEYQLKSLDGLEAHFPDSTDYLAWSVEAPYRG